MRVVFDKASQQMSLITWTLLGSNRRDLPFRSIKGAVFQTNPNQLVNEHPKLGPDVRLVLSTEEGMVPLGWLYTTRLASDVKARDAINEFLGARAEEDMDDSVGVGADVRALVAKGRTIEAIKRVRDRRLCSLAEAKRIVEAMKP